MNIFLFSKLASENVALVQELEEIRKRADYDRIMDTARFVVF